jgi:hypothetical protein
MDWSKIATIASVLSIPASIFLYIGWVLAYGPKVMSKQMLVVTILFLCFFTILSLTAVSVFRVLHTTPSTTASSTSPALAVRATPDLSRALYVGRITVDVQHLAKDYYLQLTITGFNGADAPMSINGLDGFIRYRELVNNQSINRGALPPSSIDNTASYNLSPGPWSEFWITLEQRVPSTVAIQMANSLSARGTVSLDLSSLNIWVAPQDQPTDRRRLPIWGGVSCQERDGKVFVGKVVSVSATVTVGAGISATTGSKQK